MTRLEFLAKCGELFIDPQLALENGDIVEALKANDDARVIQLLREEF